MLRITAYIIVATIIFSTPSYAYDLYVHSVKAPVYVAPDIRSGKIVEIGKGTKITGLKEKGYWHKVTYKGKKGWIYKFMVKKEPLLNKKNIYARLKSFFRKVEGRSGKSRRRSSSYTATAAARGLKEKRKRFADKHYLDYSAVEKMESIEINDNEAMDFINRGVSK